jgi:hypothetical protein
MGRKLLLRYVARLDERSSKSYGARPDLFQKGIEGTQSDCGPQGLQPDKQPSSGARRHVSKVPKPEVDGFTQAYQ